jgi:HCOMODA/2-hydroxy-3-carboxy-muconic semialdehyde decarboxylase
MSVLSEAIENLVTANRILAHEDVVDAYGHVSLRHPENPERYLLACSRSPEIVEKDDILEFTLNSECIDDQGKKLYLESPIHGSVFKARPDVRAVVHNHSYAVVPFTVSKTPLKALAHTSGRIGHEIPKWDIKDKFGDTNLLVVNNEQGDDMAEALGKHRAVLMRGHGVTVIGSSLEDAVITSIYLQVNAKLQMDAMRLGDVEYLTPGEIDQRLAGNESLAGFSRAWEYFSRRAGR